MLHKCENWHQTCSNIILMIIYNVVFAKSNKNNNNMISKVKFFAKMHFNYKTSNAAWCIIQIKLLSDYTYPKHIQDVMLDRLHSPQPWSSAAWCFSFQKSSPFAVCLYFELFWFTGKSSDDAKARKADGEFVRVHSYLMNSALSAPQLDSICPNPTS